MFCNLQKDYKLQTQKSPMRALEKLKVVDKLFDRSSLEGLDSSIGKLNGYFLSFFENLLKRFNGLLDSFVSSITTHGYSEANLENEDYNEK